MIAIHCKIIHSLLKKRISYQNVDISSIKVENFRLVQYCWLKKSPHIVESASIWNQPLIVKYFTNCWISQSLLNQPLIVKSDTFAQISQSLSNQPNIVKSPIHFSNRNSLLNHSHNVDIVVKQSQQSICFVSHDCPLHPSHSSPHPTPSKPISPVSSGYFMVNATVFWIRVSHSVQEQASSNTYPLSMQTLSSW